MISRKEKIIEFDINNIGVDLYLVFDMDFSQLYI